MSIAYFVCFSHPSARLSPEDQSRVAARVAATPGLLKARLYTPASAHDPYLDDGAPPPMVLQLDFSEVMALEDAIGADGHLQPLAALGAIPSLSGADVTQQAMLTRRYPVPDPAFRTPPGAPRCTYLVAYEGEAEDTNAWLGRYVAGHPPIMARFPGIRAIEIHTRIDWISTIPWPRAHAMQRNQVVFDDAAALNAALASEIRHEMRADFHGFPPFAGRNTHYPMNTTLTA